MAGPSVSPAKTAIEAPGTRKTLASEAIVGLPLPARLLRQHLRAGCVSLIVGWCDDPAAAAASRPPAAEPSDRRVQIGTRKRFVQMRRDVRRLLALGSSRHGDDRGAPVAVRADTAHEPRAVQPRHVQVGHNDARRYGRAEALKRFHAIDRQQDLTPETCDVISEGFTEVRVVLGDQNTALTGRHPRETIHPSRAVDRPDGALPVDPWFAWQWRRRLLREAGERPFGRAVMKIVGNHASSANCSSKGGMPRIDVEILSPFAAKFMEGSTLTPAERAEVLRVGQGFACKDSAAAASVSPETIRARRKRIYRKLNVAGSGELISSMLALSLKMLIEGARIERPPVQQPARLAGNPPMMH